jgi:hypothetical protein
VEVPFELRDRHAGHLRELLQVERLHVMILDVLDVPRSATAHAFAYMA